MGKPKHDRFFEDYDKEQLQKAKALLMKVYEYNYGTPGMSRKLKRLETIISKLEVLIKLG